MNAYAPEQNYLCGRRVLRLPVRPRAPRRVSINLKAAPPYLCDANCLYVSRPRTRSLRPSPSPSSLWKYGRILLWHMRNFQKKRTRPLELPSHDTGKSNKFGIFIVTYNWLLDSESWWQKPMNKSAQLMFVEDAAAKTEGDSQSEESNSMIGMMIRFWLGASGHVGKTSHICAKQCSLRRRL